MELRHQLHLLTRLWKNLQRNGTVTTTPSVYYVETDTVRAVSVLLSLVHKRGVFCFYPPFGYSFPDFSEKGIET